MVQSLSIFNSFIMHVDAFLASDLLFVIRKRREWDVYEPIVDILSSEEVDVLEAREERNAR